MNDPVGTLLVPAIVAAVVALAFEVLFKPSIEVRKDRRLDRDRAKRTAARRFRSLASRIEVVASVRGPYLVALSSEVGPLLDEIASARDSVTGENLRLHEDVAVLLTSCLARAQGPALGLQKTVREVIAFRDVSAFVAPVADDLDAAASGLKAAADYVEAPRWLLDTRRRALKRVRVELAKSEALKGK